MSFDLLQEMRKTDGEWEKWKAKPAVANPLKKAAMGKVPPAVKNNLNKAFKAAFALIFEEGSGWIEKTFDKDEAAIRFEVTDRLIQKEGSKKQLRRLEKTAGKGSAANSAATTAAGLGMGLLGMGLPDIPLFTAILLKGLYETALAYGVDYEEEAEKILMLRIIRAALAKGEEKAPAAALLCPELCREAELEKELEETSAALADALLAEKFLQGIPLVGAAGGIVNHVVYRQTAGLARLVYKRRYLYSRLGLGAPRL